MTLSTLGSLVLVGAGKMGGAMLSGWIDRGLDGRRVTVIDPSPGAEMTGLITRVGAVHRTDPAGVERNPAVVVIAVKPQAMAAVLPALAPLLGPETLVISIAAGTMIAGLESGLALAADSAPVVRVMPNTPAQVGMAMSVAVGNRAVSREQRAVVQSLMDAIGKTVWIDDEALMDAVTAVSGSGPAYVFLMAECLAAAARAAGLPDDLAAVLARQTVAGAGALLAASPLDPAILRQNVTSPGGTTAAALAVLMAPDGLAPLFERAVEAAADRSRELAG